jgi:Uma2 family endonuclease
VPQTRIKVGPADHGRRMSWDEFDLAEVQEGYHYELSRGVLTVSDVPGRRHVAQMIVLRRQLDAYDLTHPGRIHGILSGSDCKILVPDLDSERHPDVAVYKTPLPAGDLWTNWVPELVIEVVSPGSEHRDYEEKPQEYLHFGVKEYWVVDADRREVLGLRRWGGRWRERIVRPPEIYRTRLLPGFEFDCSRVFDAAEAAGAD